MTQKPETRVGVLIPKGNIVHQEEFDRLRPDGVTFKFLSFDYPVGDPALFCDNLAVRMKGPIAELRDWGAQAVLVGCTTASMTCAGAAFEAALREAAGVPVTTAGRASTLAAAALDARALAVATPYGEPNNRIVREFLESQGLDVISLEGLGLDQDLDVWRAVAIPMAADKVLALALAADVPAAKAVYFPCTGVRTLDAIEMFEQKVGKPAFSSVQAGYWAVLRSIGFDGRQSGNGRLIAVWDF